MTGWARKGKPQPIETWREAAWDLFSAFRLYSEAQESMGFARRAAEWGSYYQAQYIAAWHDLSSERVSRTIGDEGVDLIVQAIAYEIQHDRAPAGPDEQDLFIGLMSKQRKVFTPLSFKTVPIGSRSFVPTITLRLSTYKDRDAFMQHMQHELPRLYDRLTEEGKDRRDRAQEEIAITRLEYQEGLEPLARKIDGLGGYDILVPPDGTALDSMGRPPYNPTSGLTAEEWRVAIHGLVYMPETGWEPRTFSPPLAMERRRRSQIGAREKGYRQIARDARWWRLFVESAGEYTMARMARESQLPGHTTVSRAISELEKRFRLAPFPRRPHGEGCEV